MSYQFRKAVRTNTSVLIALAGSSGSGKTFSALRLARGLVGSGGKAALIDTEAGRALHYSDRFDFDHLDLKPPFAPETYQEAIVAAEQAGYGAIIVDSTSHEWSGDGGCQDLHDDILERMAQGDAKRAEALNILAWREPKTRHKRMVSRLLQCRAHLIFCLRAEPRLKFVKDEKTGKTTIVDAGFQPICEKQWMYEMTVSFLLSDEQPGIGRPIKVQDQHKPCFPAGALLDEQAGARLAQWAAGGTAKPDPALRVADEAAERDRLIAELQTWKDTHRPAEKTWLGLKQAHLSSGAADPRKADIAALTDLLTACVALTSPPGRAGEGA